MLGLDFKNDIFLKICKRVGGKDTEEGERNRRKLDDIYNDLWIKDMPIKEWIDKHFKFTNDVMASENNIAYTKFRCQAVANEVRKRLGKKGKYEAGEILICRLYRKEDEGKFNVNIRWRVLDANNGMVRIQDIKNYEDVRVLNESVVDKHFRYAHCATTHSRQGTSIDGTLIIHEWNKEYLVSKEWLYCSITRARDFNKVYFFKSEKADEEMFMNMVKGYFKNKCEGYKMQDRKKGREIDEENYVDANWCLKHFGGCCCRCNVKFSLDTQGGKLTTNFSAQRLCNDNSHSIDNIEPWCLDCNRAVHSLR